MITSHQLRQKYLDFFKSKGHQIIPSASLIPENDASSLFIMAGMQPLVPYLMGEKHPAGKRLVNSQKCVRTDDIDEVGDDCHHTFFEMLGNWSLGDYFKKEAIKWSWEFLTNSEWLGLNPERISITVFEGDKNAQKDTEAIEAWLSTGVPKESIYSFGKKDNWWPAGAKGTGPQGPCSEMHYNTLAEACGPNCKPGCSCGKYVEIWNDVFMQFNKTADNKFEPLKQKNVDTGMGFERTLAAINDLSDNYMTDLFQPIIKEIEKLSNKQYKENLSSFRIISDHLRSATFIMGDDLGVVPSNTDQGYIVRRLIRRAIRHGRILGIYDRFTNKIAQVVINNYKNVYHELERNKDKILSEFKKEEDKFTRTLQQGLKELNKLIQIGEIEHIKSKRETPILNRADAKKAFYIYQSFGFPLEMIQEELANHGLCVDEEEFQQEFKKHQDLSRTASEGKFKGGLTDHSEQNIKYHTATHLLHQALRQVLGDHVEQRGSNINPERLRFDFSHSEKLTDEQKQEIEDIVNQKIQENLPVTQQEMSLPEAKKNRAIGLFGSKYGERVKVYTIGDPQHPFSREICGGPHVENIGTLGRFTIKKEESSSAGIRRIKAVLK